MPSPGASEVESRRILSFPNGNRAYVVVEGAGGGGDGRLLLAAIELDQAGPRPVIVVCGGAGRLRGAELALIEAVLGPGVARASRTTGAVVVDGGTATGVMAATGEAFDAVRTRSSVLLGVAPRGRVALHDDDPDEHASLEPHHTHFVLADTDSWGGERRLLFDVAQRLAGDCPVVVALGGGGDLARKEVLEAVRRRWPVVVLARSGGLADELAEGARSDVVPRRFVVRRWWREARRRGREKRDEEVVRASAETRRILRHGDLRFLTDRDAAALARSLHWALRDDEILKEAWQTFAGYDARANALRAAFERFQRWILGLGIAGTAAALLFDALEAEPLRWITIAMPAVVAALVATASRLAPGKRWVIIRAAAESVKSEIYRYRARASPYADDDASTRDEGPAKLLSARLKGIEAQLNLTDASNDVVEPVTRGLAPRLDAAADDGLTQLDAQRYIELRLDDQLGYYRRRVKRLHRLRTRLQILSLAVGGSGTLLAAAGAEIWVALTTAIAAAGAAYLSTLQVDNTVVVYNQTAAKLAGIRRDWLAARDEKADLKDRLVVAAELALTAELSGWVQQMNSAIEANEVALAAQQARSANAGPSGPGAVA